HAATCLRSSYHINVNDRYFTQMSWSHPFSWVHALLFPILNGATIVIDHGLEGAEFLNFLIESRVNRLLGTPGQFFKILLNCSTEKKALIGIKSITVGGGQMATNVQAVFKRMKIPVAHCYGQTEALWTLSMQDTVPDENDEFPEMHKPLAGMKYKVLDANGDQIEGSESRTGLLAVTTPTMLNRYEGTSKDLEKATKGVIRGTWLYTGDMAQLEGEGETLRILPLGRKVDLIEVDGEIISMPEITAVLKSISGVDDAAAFVTLTGRGEKAIAGAVVKAATSTLTDKSILAFLQQKLHDSRLPRAIVFTDHIPKDLAGSPNYSKLRGQFSGTI
ncbi:MAG TPA: hypothetical protein DCS07_02125, partial [Bdellovibrionales bacterium]|nr:hypothetical protein [Bdellovibrionales bacterium]